MIPVSEPLLNGNEKKYLCEAIDAGEVSSQGNFVRRFEESFAKWSGNDYAVAVCSGTAALETAVWSLGIKKILVPDYTIISCAISAGRAGAAVALYENQEFKPADIMRCHLFGAFVDHMPFGKCVDDCAQYWQPFRVKDVACYSLYANKLITSGEGGILVTNDKKVYDRARSYRNLCHTEERYIHSDMGYNFRMSNLQAAVALAQLEQINKFTEIKQKNKDLYIKYLPDGVDMQFDVKVPWTYLISTKNDAGDMVKKMEELGIECRRHFYPIHRQPCFKEHKAYTNKDFPKSDMLWKYFFYLPSGLTLKEKDVRTVCKALQQALQK